MPASTPVLSTHDPSKPFNIGAELKSLQHEKRNQTLPRLPAGTAIARRPINHPPIPDIHAGAHVQKYVYVSTRTPVIAAVKRVKKILREIERRVMREAMGGKMARKTGGTGVAHGIVKANAALKTEREEVLVVGCGRAMGQALRIGEWFRKKEKEVLCDVVVRTKSVSVVDDIMQKDEGDEMLKDGDEVMTGQEESTIECGDTTLELLGDTTTSTALQGSSTEKENQSTGLGEQLEDEEQKEDTTPAKKIRKRKRKKRPTYDEGDVPEARLRWVKAVEVAISLKA